MSTTLNTKWRQGPEYQRRLTKLEQPATLLRGQQRTENISYAPTSVINQLCESWECIPQLRTCVPDGELTFDSAKTAGCLFRNTLDLPSRLPQLINRPKYMLNGCDIKPLGKQKRLLHPSLVLPGPTSGRCPISTIFAHSKAYTRKNEKPASAMQYLLSFSAC